MNERKIKYIEFSNQKETPSFGIFDGNELTETPDLYIPTLRDFHVIFWLKKGNVKFFVDFEEYKFREGTVQLLSKNQVHYFEKFNKNEIKLQSIAFTPEFIYRNDSDLHHLFSFNVSSHIDGVKSIELNDKDKTYLEMLSSNMNNVKQYGNPSIRFEAFYHHLSLFLLHIQSKDSTNEKIELSDNMKLIQKFNSLLEEDFRTKFRVDYYAEQLRLPSKRFSRLINKHFNMSPKALIDERRILEIKRRLKATSDPVKHIGYDMGFDEVTNLVKYFKKHVGVTPLFFRESS